MIIAGPEVNLQCQLRGQVACYTDETGVGVNISVEVFSLISYTNQASLLPLRIRQLHFIAFHLGSGDQFAVDKEEKREYRRHSRGGEGGREGAMSVLVLEQSSYKRSGSEGAVSKCPKVCPEVPREVRLLPHHHAP